MSHRLPPDCPRAVLGCRVASLLAGLLLLAALPAAAAPTPAELARGKYIFGATGGCGCHTAKGQPVNSGGRKYDLPFGTIYSTNITPDTKTGIGGWTDDQIIAGIRLGRRPNGDRLIPVHPYQVFNGMAADDLKALVAFLRTVPPASRANQPKKITVPFFETVFLPTWLAAFAPRETPPPTAPTTGVARGEYLVRAVGHCGECHSPRTMTQATDNSRFLGGNAKGPEDSAMPNITPDPETGIGKWSVEEIADFLGSGNKPGPEGDVAGGLMGEVIEGTLAGYKDLTKADLVAIAQYLKTIPPVRNKIAKPRASSSPTYLHAKEAR
jgi:mono/diheme cytochrome c family protein